MGLLLGVLRSYLLPGLGQQRQQHLEGFQCAAQQFVRVAGSDSQQEQDIRHRSHG